VRFNGTTPEIQALAVGELEIASMAPSAFDLGVTNARLDIRMVSDCIGDGQPGWYDEPYMVKNGGPIKTIEDIKVSARQKSGRLDRRRAELAERG
jgi:NitT/TauT family transport system substrate-binding protein